MPKLSIEDLKVRYGPIVGTDGVALTLEAGETLALIGSNGAGKSSTLKAILGMATYSQGTITLDGTDLKGLKPSQVVRLGVGYSPEGRRVFPQLSVLDNLKGRRHLPQRRRAARSHPAHLRVFSASQRSAPSQRAGSLSGGEQQMLAIGRALMSKPSLLMLDEPSLGPRAGAGRAHRRDPAGDPGRRRARRAAGRAERDVGPVAGKPRRDPRRRPHQDDRQCRASSSTTPTCARPISECERASSAPAVNGLCRLAAHVAVRHVFSDCFRVALRWGCHIHRRH